MSKTRIPVAKPVLKWAGGKRELIPSIREYYKNLNPGNYVEPFFGGGAVYFDILKTFGSQLSDTSIINDINTDLICMYRDIKSSPDEIIYQCKKIEDDTMKRCEDAVEFARNSEFPKPEEVFEDMWANPIPLP